MPPPLPLPPLPRLLDLVQARLFLLALALRAALLALGAAMDGSGGPVRYTDADYAVFTDAAAALQRGGSPYARATYRYPPLFALLLAPGAALGCAAQWGKLLFVGGDLAVGALQCSVLRAQGLRPAAARAAAALFLLSPLAAVTSTRGSADSLACALALGALAGLLHGRLALGGLALGLAIHVRLYPVIYALPCALHLLLLPPPAQAAQAAAKGLHWRRLLAFAVPAALGLALPTACAVWAYGPDALQEAYLHHAARVDVRHNFSPLWLPLYLASPSGSSSGGASWAAAAPLSLLAALAVGALAWRDAAACFFLQTLAFTATNRVLTAQYFNWWMALLPLLAPRSRMPVGVACACALGWLAAEVHWVRWAMELEVRGESVFLQVHGASLVLAAAHAALGAAVAAYHVW
jgi:phosphatidylinositol glycan class M